MPDNIRPNYRKLRYQSEIEPHRKLYASDILVVNGQPQDLAWFKDLLENPEPTEGIKLNEWDRERGALRKILRKQVKRCDLIPPRIPTLHRWQGLRKRNIRVPKMPASHEIAVPFLRIRVEQDAMAAREELEKLITGLGQRNNLTEFPVKFTIDRIAGQLSRKGVGSPNHSVPQIMADGASFGMEFLSLIGWDTQNQLPGADGDGVTVMILDTAPNNPAAPQPFDFWFDLSDTIPFTGPNGNFAIDYPPEVDSSTTAGRPAGLENLNWRETIQYHGLLIAAVVKSIAPKAHVFLVKVLNDDGENLESSLRYALNCISEACSRSSEIDLLGPVLDPKKLVLNLSWGLFLSLYPEINFTEMLETCKRLAEQGVTIVAAAGNDTIPDQLTGTRKRAYPAEPAAYGYDYPALLQNFKAITGDDPEFQELDFSKFSPMSQVIPVAAIEAAKGTGYAAFSDFGTIGAPGETIEMEIEQGNGIPVIQADGSVAPFTKVVWSGSSFATPQVAAAAALLLQAGVAPSDIKECLLNSADPIPNINNYVPPITELDLFQNHVPKLNIRRALDTCNNTGATAKKAAGK